MRSYVWGLARALGGEVFSASRITIVSARDRVGASDARRLDWLGLAPDVVPDEAYRRGAAMAARVSLIDSIAFPRPAHCRGHRVRLPLFTREMQSSSARRIVDDDTRKLSTRHLSRRRAFRSTMTWVGGCGSTQVTSL